MSADVVRVDAIRVEDRARTEYRNIDSLAGSIQTLGLLHPPVVTADLRLIAGGRRIEAVRALGWERVPVTVAQNITEAAELMRAEMQENVEREPLTVEEEALLYRRILDLEKAEAKGRQGERSDLTSGKISQKSGRAKDQAAAAVSGKAGRAKTLDKALDIIDKAVDASLPEPVREAAQQALRQMNETGNVHGAQRHLQSVEESVIEVTPEAVAISEALKNDPELIDRSYMLNFHKSIAKADDLFTFDAARIARLASQDDIDSIRQFTEQANRFYDDIIAARPGLRLVGGN